MSRDEANQKLQQAKEGFQRAVGGRGRAGSILAVGCLLPGLLICGLLVGGVNWVRSFFVTGVTAYPAHVAIYEPYLDAQTAANDCDGDEYVLKLWRGGYACAKDY